MPRSLAARLILPLPALAMMPCGAGFAAPATPLSVTAPDAPPAPAEDAPALFDPASGMRIARYRAPVDRPIVGATRISTDQAIVMRRDPAVLFIDVLPAAGSHRDPATGRWALATPHSTIAGAHWFPESGRGVLSPDIEHWFLAGIARLTGGSKARPLVLFCLADCWMSWNAARRLASAGYTNIAWFPDGTDGWLEQAQPTEPATPEP